MLSSRCWLHLYHNCESSAVHVSTSPLLLLQGHQLKSPTKAVTRSCYSKRSNLSPVTTANTVYHFCQPLGLRAISSSLGHRNCHFQWSPIYRQTQKAATDTSVLGLRTLHKADKNSWSPWMTRLSHASSNCTVVHINWARRRSSLLKLRHSTLSTQQNFSQTCSHFFLRYGNYVKKKSLSFRKRIVPTGTHV